MGREKMLVLLLAVTVHAIAGAEGQAPFLKVENQCGALYDPQLFHVCSAGASLRSARSSKQPNPFAAAAMSNAQSLLDEAAVLLGRVPSLPKLTRAPTHRVATAQAGLVNRLKHSKQTLTVSACILSNSAQVLNDAIRALEDGAAYLEQDSAPAEPPVVTKPVAADSPTEAFRPSQGLRVPSINVDVSVNGKPVDVKPIIEVTQTSNSGKKEALPQADEVLPETVTTSVEKLTSLNGKVHKLSEEVSFLLQRLGVALTTPHRSQSFVNMARAPLEEIQAIQLVLAKSEGAELDDEWAAEIVVRDLQLQQEALTKMLDNPEKLMERMKLPKDKNETQALVADLRALKKTVTNALPHPKESD